MNAESPAPVGPACPECGETGEPVVFGLPSYELWAKAERGGFKLGGCVVWGDKPVWSCAQGHSWQADDGNLWAAVLDTAMRRAESEQGLPLRQRPATIPGYVPALPTPDESPPADN